MFKNEFIVKLKWLLIFVVLYTIIFFIISSTLSYTLPFILALILSIWINPFYELLKKKFKMKNSISALISTIVIFASAFTVFTWIVYRMIIEAKDLMVYIPKITVSADYIVSYFEKYKPYYDKIDPGLANKIQQMTISLGTKVLDIIQEFLRSLFSFALKLPITFMVIFVTMLATYFFLRDLPNFKRISMSIFSSKGKEKVIKLLTQANKMFAGYLRSYMFIIFLTFLQTYIGFSILKVRYSLILSIACAVFDILPILGPAGIYIPLALIYLVLNDYFTATTLILLYLFITIVRQIIEPKIVSSSLGIHPIAVLAAIFMGIKANGITGMVYLTFLIVFYKIFKSISAPVEYINSKETPVK